MILVEMDKDNESISLELNDVKDTKCYKLQFIVQRNASWRDSTEFNEFTLEDLKLINNNLSEFIEASENFN